ncbi:hypothetical protein KBB08_02095 [Candidatus Gracilibacteria bacterium]|nr:hypothetical protein [Candidatus Gracilibacteria bacterium]
MINIAEVVKELISADYVHLESLRTHTLNLHAYASLIQPTIELRAKKPVKVGSIVMALSRLSKSLASVPELIPTVVIETLVVKSGLTVVNYEKTSKLIAILSQASIARSDRDFFVISEALAEIAIVAPNENMKVIEALIPYQPKSKFTDAVAITLRFGIDYVVIPNVLYAFVSTLAMRRINLLEIVSTLTEVAFIIENKDMDVAVDIFKRFLP